MNDFNMRLAKENDAKLLWLWANDPATRKNTFHPQNIKWKEHINWFHNSLNSKNTRIWILEYNDEQVGQIRYDRVNNIKAEIDFSIDRNFRGKGLGTRILMMTAIRACESLKVKLLEGIVLEFNKSSRRAFVKANYKLIGKKTIRNKICCVFQWDYSSY